MCASVVRACFCYPSGACLCLRVVFVLIGAESATRERFKDNVEGSG